MRLHIVAKKTVKILILLLKTMKMLEINRYLVAWLS